MAKNKNNCKCKNMNAKNNARCSNCKNKENN